MNRGLFTTLRNFDAVDTERRRRIFVMGMAISPLGGMPKHRVRLFEPRTLHAHLFLTSPL
jgi:hypothetical protein